MKKILKLDYLLSLTDKNLIKATNKPNASIDEQKIYGKALQLRFTNDEEFEALCEEVLG